MPNRADLLQQRIAAFGSAINAVSTKIPRDPAGQNITRQIVRAGTAPVALYSEARDAESNLEYIHKMKVGLKELRETDSWLTLARNHTNDRLNAAPIQRECNELISIFVACIRKARSRRGGTDA